MFSTHEGVRNADPSTSHELRFANFALRSG